MDTTATNKKLREIISAISQDRLVLKPGFQRNLVWTAKHKNNIIRTVLKGYPFPEIFVATIDCDRATASSKEGIVDGQQRITTLYKYFKGDVDFKLEEDIPPYNELSGEQQISFLEYVVVVRDLGIIDDAKIREIFQRLNSTNYNLNSMEINHALYDGIFSSLCERLADNEFFENKKFFTANDIRRMKDRQYIASILATIILGYFDGDKKLDDCFRFYNEIFDQEKELEKGFKKILLFIDDMHLQNSRIYQKADFFTLFVELYHIIVDNSYTLDVTLVAEELSRFYSRVDLVENNNETQDEDLIAAKTYKNCIIQGTNHRSSRITRGIIIDKIIMATLSGKH